MQVDFFVVSFLSEDYLTGSVAPLDEDGAFAHLLCATQDSPWNTKVILV
jgi:hypothetical protein